MCTMNGVIHEKDKKKKRIPPCEKVRSAESTKCLKSLLTLKQQEYLLEKNLSNLMENMKLEPEVLRPILHNMSDISKNRQILQNSMKKSLEEIIKELQSAQSVTNCPEQIQKLDTNAYKQRLVKLSQKIRDFQESCQLQIATLSQDQTALESELHEFESNLHKYENVTGSIGKSTSAASSNKENKRCYDYKEIKDFHELIAKTGHTDNWSDEDHLLFLKMRKKCSSIPAMVAAIRIKCPDLTVETIVNHEAWYKVYLNQREKQRSSVREWRKRKEMEKMKMRNREDETEDKTLEEISREKRNSNITKDLSTCIMDKCQGRTTKSGNSVDIDNQKKELIRQWKAERENKRLMDEEQSRILMESKIAAQEKRKRERLKRLRKVLAERKLIEVSSETSKDDSRAGPKYNPMLIKAFRKQDAEYTRRKKNLIARRKLAPSKNQTVNIVKSQIVKKQDHSTLLNSTEVWREKCKIYDPNTREPKKLQYIKDVPRLYVQWRNKESMEIKNALTFS